MAIYRSSDSLSRCDSNQYSNIYDVRKRPDVKRESIDATRPVHKDTIEISRDKLKEEALNRLRHTSKYVIAQNSFMRIGKYLFLAVAFPPYFLVYGLPKWLLVEGMPVLLSMSLWMWKKIQHQAQKRLETGSRQVIQVLHFVQRLTKVLMQPMIHLALQIRQEFNRLRDRTFQIFRNIAGKIKQTVPFSSLRLIQKEKLKNIQKRIGQVKEKFSEQIQKIGVSLEEGIQWIKEAPQVFLGWGQLQFQKFNDQAISLRMHWKNRFHPAQERAQQATDWIANQFKKGASVLKKQVIPLMNLYRKHWLPRWNKLKNDCQGKWQGARHFFQNGHQKMIAFLQAQQEKIKRLSSDQILIDIISGSWISAWMGMIPVSVQNWLKGLFSHPFVRLICGQGVRFFLFSADAALQIAQLSLRVLSQSGSFVFKVYAKLRTMIKGSLRNTLHFIRVGQRIFLKTAWQSVYYLLLFLTMGIILLIWSVRLLGGYTRAFIAMLSSKKRIIN